MIRVDPGIGALLALPPSDTEDAAQAEMTKSIAQLDKELSNNLLSVPEYKAASKVHTAYVHISKSIDVPEPTTKKGKQDSNKSKRTPEGLFARHFSLNSRVKALRILSTSNLIDGIASCATAKSIVEAHVLTHDDIVPGKIYRNVPVIQLLDGGGVLVDLGVGTKGIIPAMHLFDKASHGNPDAGGDMVLSGYRQKIRLAKYKVGSHVDVRCLTVDAASRHCILTAKKTLLTTDIDNPIVEYTPLSVEPDRVAAGFISRVDENGVTVTFYNNIHGRVYSRSLAAELGVEDPRLNYTVGDVVVARVVDCERRRNRNATYGDDENQYYYQLKLSLKTVVEKKVEPEVKTAEDGDGTKDSGIPLAAGSILVPKRMKVLQLVSCFLRDDGMFLPGYAVVSVKSKFFTALSNGCDSVDFKLPFDQLLDSYGDELSKPPVELDEIAKQHLTVGKRIDAEGLIISVPYGDSLPVVSLRPSLIDTIKRGSSDDYSVICPSPRSNLFMGEYVRGFVTRIDDRFGAFVRFMDGLTGLIPKLKKGLNENLYDTILCKVTALDITSSPPKILLKKVSESEIAKKKKKVEAKSKKSEGARQFQVGDVVGDVKVADINFARAKVYVLGNSDSSKSRARIHVTMADALSVKPKLSKKEKQTMEEHKIGKSHPFYSWKVGDVISGVRCVAVDSRDGVNYVELSNRADSSPNSLPVVVSDPSHLPASSDISAIVTSVSSASTYHGLWVQICPGVSGFVPALELSTDPDVLNDLRSHYSIGSRISCRVMPASKDSASPKKLPSRHQLQRDEHDDQAKEHDAIELSVLLAASDASEGKQSPALKPNKPRKGDIIVGCINRKTRMHGPPSLMLSLRGGYMGRCCITELTDVDDWVNMPLGKILWADEKQTKENYAQQRVVSDSDADQENEVDDVSETEEVAKR